MAGEIEQSMDREAELRFLTKSAKQNAEAASKAVEAINEAIRQQQEMVAALQKLGGATVAQVKLGAQQGMQAAIQQAAKTDIAPQIEAAVKPTLTVIHDAVSQLRGAINDAERAAASLSRHKLVWKEMALMALLGVCLGTVLVWFFVRADINAALQRVQAPVVIQQKSPPPAKDKGKLKMQQQTPANPDGESQ